MDLTPAETTPTGVLLSSVKSALISKANYQKYVGGLSMNHTILATSMDSTHSSCNKEGYPHCISCYHCSRDCRPTTQTLIVKNNKLIK